MKIDRKNLIKNYWADKKKFNIRDKNKVVYKYKNLFKIKSNFTSKISVGKHACKITGANFAIHRKTNLNRHFIRLFDNKKYLESWQKL